MIDDGDSMDNEKGQCSVVTTGKPYSPPMLKEFGGVAEITRTAGNLPPGDSGANNMLPTV